MFISIGGMKNNTVVKRNALTLNRQFHLLLAGVQPQQSPGIPSGWTGLANKWMTRGDQASVSEARNFIFKKSFYTLTCTYRKMKDARSCRVSSNIPALLPLLKPGFFLHTFPINKGPMLCTLSSGLGGLLTFYDPFLIKIDQTENFFSLEVFFFFIPLIRVSLRKY